MSCLTSRDVEREAANGAQTKIPVCHIRLDLSMLVAIVFRPLHQSKRKSQSTSRNRRTHTPLLMSSTNSSDLDRRAFEFTQALGMNSRRRRANYDWTSSSSSSDSSNLDGHDRMRGRITSGRRRRPLRRARATSRARSFSSASLSSGSRCAGPPHCQIERSHAHVHRSRHSSTPRRRRVGRSRSAFRRPDLSDSSSISDYSAGRYDDRRHGYRRRANHLMGRHRAGERPYERESLSSDSGTISDRVRRHGRSDRWSLGTRNPRQGRPVYRRGPGRGTRSSVFYSSSSEDEFPHGVWGGGEYDFDDFRRGDYRRNHMR